MHPWRSFDYGAVPEWQTMSASGMHDRKHKLHPHKADKEIHACVVIYVCCSSKYLLDNAQLLNWMSSMLIILYSKPSIILHNTGYVWNAGRSVVKAIL